MRVLSIVGARPQFVKLAPIARALEEAGHSHTILHTGQHYDAQMSDSFFADLRIPNPDSNLGVGSGAHGAQTAAMLKGIESFLFEQDLDWVLVYGDTNSTLAGALAASKIAVPVAHLEAGLRSFNRQMPEELNRVATDHLSDLLLAPTQVASDNLNREGLGERTVITGDVMTDICIETSQKVGGRPHLPDDIDEHDPFVVATIHRPANTDDPHRLDAILNALGGVSAPVVLAAHPRLMAKVADFGLDIPAYGVHVREPFTYPDMIRALTTCVGVVTDSGGLQKEAFLLGAPTVTLRGETEWPETLAGGWNILDPELVQVSAEAARSKPGVSRGHPYGDGTAANQVVAALQERLL